MTYFYQNIHVVVSLPHQYLQPGGQFILVLFWKKRNKGKGFVLSHNSIYTAKNNSILDKNNSGTCRGWYILLTLSVSSIIIQTYLSWYSIWSIVRYIVKIITPAVLLARQNLKNFLLQKSKNSKPIMDKSSTNYLKLTPWPLLLLYHNIGRLPLLTQSNK